LRGLPNRTPLCFAASRPALVPLTDEIPLEFSNAGEHRHNIFPAWVVVLAQGSDND
jgi:hypothetical protein